MKKFVILDLQLDSLVTAAYQISSIHYSTFFFFLKKKTRKKKILVHFNL